MYNKSHSLRLESSSEVSFVIVSLIEIMCTQYNSFMVKERLIKETNHAEHEI